MKYRVLNSVVIRTRPDWRAKHRRADSATLDTGSVFHATQRVRGYKGDWYVRLADGRGWVFESKEGKPVLEDLYSIGTRLEARYNAKSKTWKPVTVRGTKGNTLTVEFDGSNDLITVPDDPGRVRPIIRHSDKTAAASDSAVSFPSNRKRPPTEGEDLRDYRKVSRPDYTGTGRAEMDMLRYQGNQYKFFHGTSWTNSQIIQKNGFRTSSTGCLGEGVYIARQAKAERFAKNHSWHGGLVGG